MPEKLEYCRNCGGQHPAHQLSNRGYCARCGFQKWQDAVNQLKSKSGPAYEKWRAAYIAAMDGVLKKLRKEQ